MKLSVKALGIASMLTWGGALFLVGAINWLNPNYGRAFLQMAKSVYPGYHAMTGGWSVLVGTGYALVDGFICGAIFALIYNLVAKRNNT